MDTNFGRSLESQTTAFIEKCRVHKYGESEWVGRGLPNAYLRYDAHYILRNEECLGEVLTIANTSAEDGEQNGEWFMSFLQHCLSLPTGGVLLEGIYCEEYRKIVMQFRHVEPLGDYCYLIRRRAVDNKFPVFFESVATGE